MKEMKIDKNDVMVPMDVPEDGKDDYLGNFMASTHETGRLMLFAGDQKVEHLNDDFFGEGIHPDDADPIHLFKIASEARIGVFAVQLGLISKYGRLFPDIPYLVKMNSKTHLVETEQKDPLSAHLWDVDQIAEMRSRTDLKILGVGATVYLGSEYEAEMLRSAAQMVHSAHRNGLLAVLWMYPRGKAVPNEKDPHLIAGATGVACALGADFAKVNYPKMDGKDPAELLREAVIAGGNTRVICAGGSSVDVRKFLQQLHDQIHVSGASGSATGRNIHQKSLDEAVGMCNAISALTLDDASVDDAYRVYNER